MAAATRSGSLRRWMALGVMVAVIMLAQMSDSASALDLKKKLPKKEDVKKQGPKPKVKPNPKPIPGLKKPDLKKPSRKRPRAPEAAPKPKKPITKQPPKVTTPFPSLPKPKLQKPGKLPSLPSLPGHVKPHLPFGSAISLSALPGLPNLPNLPVNPLAPFTTGAWANDAHATFYGDPSGSATFGGACGYGDLMAQGYGLQTTALSEVLFSNGFSCGQCYQIQCIDSKWCIPNAVITVTATNLCPADYSKPNDNGGWCNPPLKHFDLSMPAFHQIAQEVAGIVPVTYRRVPCVKLGGVKFTILGNTWWHLVLITNVGGAGDIDTASIKGSNTDWIPMSHNWGASFQCFQSLVNQALSFQLTSTTGQVLTTFNVAPADWSFGTTYEGGQYP